MTGRWTRSVRQEGHRRIKNLQVPAGDDKHADGMSELEELRAEVALCREQMNALHWARMQERFHAFDGIKDDKCPACGGRVRAVETRNSVRLEAIR